MFILIFISQIKLISCNIFWYISLTRQIPHFNYFITTRSKRPSYDSASNPSEYAHHQKLVVRVTMNPRLLNGKVRFSRATHELGQNKCNILMKTSKTRPKLTDYLKVI